MWLRGQGEVCGCDLVALDASEPTAVVIGELKLTFTLDLVPQAVDRSAACDEVWLAVRASRRGRGREHDRRVRKLCRLLGFGLLSVLSAGKVEVVVEPVPWRPRRDAKRRSRIVERRQGDPTMGGSTRQPIMTAYRQQALVCAAALAQGRATPRLKGGVPDAPRSCFATSTAGSSGSSAGFMLCRRQAALRSCAGRHPSCRSREHRVGAVQAAS